MKKKNKLAYCYLLFCLLGNFTHLSAQPTVVIYPASTGTANGAIEFGLPPSVSSVPYTYNWYQLPSTASFAETRDVYNLSAGNYRLAVNRPGWCEPAIFDYTVPSVSGTAPQIKFIPGYDAVKVKVVSGTATNRLFKQLSVGSPTEDSGWIDIADIEGDGVESILAGTGIEAQNTQQYFIVHLGDPNTNSFRILVQTLANSIVDSQADDSPKTLHDFASHCSRTNMVQDIKACLSEVYNPTNDFGVSVDNFYNEKCTDGIEEFRVSLKFPPNNLTNVPTLQGDNIEWDKNKNEYHFTLQKLDGSYITDPISTADTYEDGDGFGNFLTTRINTEILLNGTDATGQIEGRLWCTQGSGAGGVHVGCTVAGIMSCADQSYAYPAFGSNGNAFMKDCGDDDGIDHPGDIPITPCHANATDWYNIWESPDLWVNANAEGNADANNQAIEQNNYIHVRLRNKDTQRATTPGKIVLYWTVASTGEVWTEDWIDIDGDDCLVGGIIDKIDVPSIPANMPDGQIFNFHWNSGFPTASTTSPANCEGQINGILDGKIEMCLLARFIADLDPIADERLNEDAITQNIARNDNIVTRNTIYIVPGGYTEGILVPSIPSVIYVKNNNNFATNLNVLLQSIVKLTPAQQSQYNFDLVFTQTLWDKWTSTGAQGIGLSILEDKVVRITNFNTAKLLNIPMLANERNALGLKLTRISTGKNHNFIPDTEFKLMITHEASDPTVPIATPSACILFEVKSKQTISSYLPNLQISPNPAATQITVSGYPSTTDTYLLLHDIAGRTVLQQKLSIGSSNISIAHLPIGLYLCEVRDQQNQVIETNKLTIVR